MDRQLDGKTDRLGHEPELFASILVYGHKNTEEAKQVMRYHREQIDNLRIMKQVVSDRTIIIALIVGAIIVYGMSILRPDLFSGWIW
jgi:hypothetical protein